MSDKEDKEVPKVIPTLQSGTTERMKQPAAGSENSEENPIEKSSPSDANQIDANQITKDETNGQGETPQNSENVM